MRISDWSSDVCSSDLDDLRVGLADAGGLDDDQVIAQRLEEGDAVLEHHVGGGVLAAGGHGAHVDAVAAQRVHADAVAQQRARSEEHTSELQSLMRISYAVFCLKKKKKKIITQNND